MAQRCIVRLLSVLPEQTNRRSAASLQLMPTLQLSW